MLAGLRFVLFAFWLFLAAGLQAQPLAKLVIVSSERSSAYTEASEALLSELERAGLARQEVLQLSADELPTDRLLTPKLIVALGSQAASVLAKTELRVPVLCTLLPRASFERALLAAGRKPSPQFSAIYLDQPLTRQIELIRQALPSARKLGVLWGPDSTSQASVLRALSQSRGLELVEAMVGPDMPLFPSLQKVLDGADALLAVADPVVYNSNSIQNILLTSFRAKVPLVAFSPAYVRAGALLALHVTPAQIGRQAGVLARGVLQGRSLPALPVYSQDFSVAINEHVARSMNLRLDADALRLRILPVEAAP
jgi:putative tryptophan/tyrosine transport system substrate-binding protein